MQCGTCYFTITQLVVDITKDKVGTHFGTEHFVFPLVAGSECKQEVAIVRYHIVESAFVVLSTLKVYIVSLDIERYGSVFLKFIVGTNAKFHKVFTCALACCIGAGYHVIACVIETEVKAVGQGVAIDVELAIPLANKAKLHERLFLVYIILW